LNDDELKLFRKKLEESEISDALKLVDETTSGSLEQLKDDLDKYLEKKPEKEKEEEEKKEEEVNPFGALFSFPKSEKNKKEEDKSEEPEKNEGTGKKGIQQDSFKESVVRKLAEMQAAEGCFNLFNIYKKTHDMAAPQRDVDFWEIFQSKGKKGF
jgi:hypothetical protein